MKHQICGIVTEARHLEQTEGCDLVEIRADLLLHEDIPTLISRSPLPVILTLRSVQHGGRFKGSEKEQQDLLLNWAEARPAFLDVEAHLPIELFRDSNIRLLRSYHNCTETPDELEQLYQEMSSSHVDHYKMVTQANRSIDGLRMLEFVEKMKGAVTGFCLGEKGRFTRILAPGRGSGITYIPLGEKTDPGQLTLEEALHKYRLKKRSSSTELYGLIGQPVCHSPSVRTHQEALNGQHLDALYTQIEVAPDEWEAFIAHARHIPFKGLSVTMPLKQMLNPPMNTLKILGSAYEARNTDGIGAMRALEEPKGKRIVILGAGGAAQGIAKEAEKSNHVTLLNRQNISSLPSLEYDILINTIPPPARPIEKIREGTLCMEISVRDEETPFTQLAKQFSCRCIEGYAMFVHQANEQFKWWFETTDDFLHDPSEHN